MRVHLLFVFAALLRVPLLGAQDTASLVGSRMRICSRTIEPGALVASPSMACVKGTLETSTGDSIWISRDDSSGVAALPLADVTSLERYDGSRGSSGTGALTGAVLGGLSAAVIYAAVGEESSCSCCSPCFGAAGKTLGVALLGAGAGALVGAVIGSSIPRDRWTKVEPARLSAGPVSVLGAPGLAVRITF